MSGRPGDVAIARYFTKAEIDEIDAYDTQDHTQEGEIMIGRVGKNYSAGHRIETGPTAPPPRTDAEIELPPYQKSTGGAEDRVRRAVAEHRDQADRLETAMERTVEAFAAALEREDRRNATLSRLKNKANPKVIEEHNARVLGRGRGIA